MKEFNRSLTKERDRGKNKVGKLQNIGTYIPTPSCKKQQVPVYISPGCLPKWKQHWKYHVKI